MKPDNVIDFINPPTF